MDWRESRAYRKWFGLHRRKKTVRITWLARARLLSGHSVTEAAKACGVEPRSWERWEQGRSEPPTKATLAISNVYPIPLSALLNPYVTVRPATLEVLR